MIPKSHIQFSLANISLKISLPHLPFIIAVKVAWVVCPSFDGRLKGDLLLHRTGSYTMPNPPIIDLLRISAISLFVSCLSQQFFSKFHCFLLSSSHACQPYWKIRWGLGNLNVDQIYFNNIWSTFDCSVLLLSGCTWKAYNNFCTHQKPITSLFTSSI